MFNGIIFNKGLITKISKRSKGIDIFVKSDLKLTNKDICIEIKKTVDYLRARLSKKIILEFENCNHNVITKINSQLFGWCLENIIKNSIDSIKEEGKVIIKLEEGDEFVKIYIIDNGIGIKKNLQRKIFRPGVTTKKRGWGLGLSLAKRIIEEYHNGQIKVLESTVGKGTKLLIQLKAFKGI